MQRKSLSGSGLDSAERRPEDGQKKWRPAYAGRHDEPVEIQRTGMVVRRPALPATASRRCRSANTFDE